ncbi:MAG: sugar phosphate isomerase/epimerase [Saprospiraceae bacterium]|nr:sugar phosphate isomerase/epimerase [Saprospiraceae bacterium]
MKRRKFNELAAMSIGASISAPIQNVAMTLGQKYVRLGGPVFEKYSDPDQWISALKQSDYRAAYCPVKVGTEEAVVKAYEKAAFDSDIVIAEVGAWSNMVSPDDEERKKAIEKCVRSLELAELINANCCVNVTGSRNLKHWAGPHEDNLTKDTFDLIIETTREIIDSVKPSRTYFALEPMPWAYPDSIDSYLKLFKAINRPRFGVHFDPVNMISSPQLYYKNGHLIREGIRKLGPYIRSCHAKDITLREDNYIPQLDECQPGLGKLNYDVFLSELSRLKDIPLMMEHLKTAAEYAAGADYIRSVGERNDIVV